MSRFWGEHCILFLSKWLMICTQDFKNILSHTYDSIKLDTLAAILIDREIYAK